MFFSTNPQAQKIDPSKIQAIPGDFETDYPIEMATNDKDTYDTLLIDHTEPPLEIDWPNLNRVWPAIKQNVLDVRKYRKVSVLISSTQGSPYLLNGRYENIYSKLFIPKDGLVHTFDIVGPHLLMYIWGQGHMQKEEVSLYLYLTS